MNFGYQAARHLDNWKQAKLEREAATEAIKVLATNEDVRDLATSELKNEITNLENYTANNIGKAVGRGIASVMLRPFGIIGMAGDAAQSLNNGGDMIRDTLLATRINE